MGLVNAVVAVNGKLLNITRVPQDKSNHSSSIRLRRVWKSKCCRIEENCRRSTRYKKLSPCNAKFFHHHVFGKRCQYCQDIVTLEERMLALLNTKTEPLIPDPQPKTGRSRAEKRESIRGRQGETVTLRCRLDCLSSAVEIILWLSPNNPQSDVCAVSAKKFTLLSSVRAIHLRNEGNVDIVDELFLGTGLTSAGALSPLAERVRWRQYRTCPGKYLKPDL